MPHGYVPLDICNVHFRRGFRRALNRFAITFRLLIQTPGSRQRILLNVEDRCIC